MIEKLPSQFVVKGESGTVPFTTFETAALDALRRSVNELIEAVDQLQDEVQQLRKTQGQGDLWRLKAR